MSLLNQNRAFGLGDYLFIAAGILAGIWFFLSYPSQDPRSIMQASMDKESATLRAAELLNSFGYSTGNLNTKAEYQVNGRLLDSLQKDLGRPEAIQTLKDETDKQVFPYLWRVFFHDATDSTMYEFGSPGDENSISVMLNDQGRWIGLRNEGNLLPNQLLRRQALQYAFKEDSTRQLWQNVPDSAWDGVLSFDLENGYDAAVLQQPEVEKEDGSEHVFSAYELMRLGDYYLRRSAWSPEDFNLKEIQLQTFDDMNGAGLSYDSKNELLQQQVHLHLSVVPTGSLIAMEVTYNREAQGASLTELWSLVTLAGIFLFGIVAVVTFFMRIRARVVDTKSSLVISILAGLAIPTVIFLQRIEALDFFAGELEWFRLFGVAFEMGILGALGSISFFVVAAIGDSILRQHWQQKLTGYDYIRQGLLFNRPVGETIVRSVVLMLFLAGLWSLLLTVFPGAYLHVEHTFLVFQAAWPPVYMLLNNAWVSLIFVMGIFLVVGGLVYARAPNKWAYGIATTLAAALIGPLPFLVGPNLFQFVMMGLFGVALTLIYLKWDVLTLLFSHFLTTCLLVVSTGWFMNESHDAYVLATFLLLILFVVAWGSFSIAKGTEAQSLPSFVPEYVEELAQEQRIKQELQIARDVQQSFLPIETPDLEGLDIAAICQPAYETGGDYYDFIQLDDHRVAVTIGDVSGKGIQAAFYMTFTKGILHTLCRETDSPGELLKKANRLFFDNARKGTFISLVYGIIDLRAKTFTFARAGHNPILYLHGQTGELEELQPNGLGIGLTKTDAFDKNIREVKLNLGDGDLLVLYTDGIVEALNETHKFYGDERLQTVLKEYKDNTSQEILNQLSNDVITYIGSSTQHDDMTIMVIKMNGRLAR